MRRQRHRWAGCLALTAALTVLLLVDHPSAQAPGQGAGTLLAPDVPDDEEGARLLSGPDGEVFRLWNTWVGLQTGGGGVFLARATPNDTWQKLLELVPSETGVTALDPDVALGSSKDVAIAYQWRRQLPRTKEVRLAISDDRGKTWTHSPTGIEGSGQGFSPKVAWGRGRSLVAVWADERRRSRAWVIYSRRSPDGGRTWEPEQLVSRFPTVKPIDIDARPSLISDGQDRFWVMWVGVREGRSRYYFSRSADGGRTWTDPLALTGQSANVINMRFVRSGERLLLVWQDGRTGQGRIYAVASGDGGVTWSSPTRVDHDPPESRAPAAFPDVALGSDGEAVVVWQDGRNGRDDIFVGRSTDGGRTWGTEDTRLDMDEPGTAASQYSAIARAEDGRLAVAWADDRAGRNGVYLRVRTGGQFPAWGPEVLLAPPGPKKSADVPLLLWGRGGALYVTWQTSEIPPGSLVGKRRLTGRTLFPDKP